jgi:hypothetical protein
MFGNIATIFVTGTMAILTFYKRYRRMPRGLTPGLNPISRDTNH